MKNFGYASPMTEYNRVRVKPVLNFSLFTFHFSFENHLINNDLTQIYKMYIKNLENPSIKSVKLCLTLAFRYDIPIQDKKILKKSGEKLWKLCFVSPSLSARVL